MGRLSSHRPATGPTTKITNAAGEIHGCSMRRFVTTAHPPPCRHRRPTGPGFAGTAASSTPAAGATEGRFFNMAWVRRTARAQRLPDGRATPTVTRDAASPGPGCDCTPARLVRSRVAREGTFGASTAGASGRPSVAGYRHFGAATDGAVGRADRIPDRASGVGSRRAALTLAGVVRRTLAFDRANLAREGGGRSAYLLRGP